MEAWKGGRQVVAHDPHSSQRSLVFDEERAARRSARRRWLRSFACLLVALLVLLLVLGCLGGIIWLVVKPKSPSLVLQGVTLHDIKVQVANGTTNAGNPTVLYLNSTLLLLATNTNRISVGYSTVHLNVTYGDVMLENTTLPAFRLHAHGNTSIGIPLSVDNREFFQPEGRYLLRDADNNNLPLKLTGVTTAEVYTFGKKSLMKLQMDCDIVIQYQDLKVHTNACKTRSSKL
ncbi:uncharacterized protein [Physcomitrium patens]|uniref:Late embryogenesis abundant protein LEA-2 subgroup domain-containing protein n=1 Tax=Physcomitrium patens TaxID=3218 RepID=A0A2K1K2B4_PHYPA|nr:uncharacterized protein LOC112286471 [Physcomitrium patens]PNR47915.1 hypothetical protein PHYPA_012388 [Physcomitrium patens]|eukprot:XP_024384151.1 uncharacterized protein LOC112286471 [Physcomitrella patens]